MGTWSWNTHLPAPPLQPKFCVRCGSELLRKRVNEDPKDIYIQFHICETPNCHYSRMVVSIIYFLIIFVSFCLIYGSTFFVIATVVLFLDTHLFFNKITNVIMLPLYVYYMLHPRHKEPPLNPRLWK